jgi:hypothetical protein
MTRAFLLVAAAGALLLAGCSAPPPSAAPPAQDAVQFEDSAIQVTLPALPTEPPAPGERTLGAAPVWRLGEWWSIHMVDHFQGHEVDAVRVVAGTTFTDYLVGFPKDDFRRDVLAFHVPGYGDVAKGNLSYEVHDRLFAPLQFPLVAGDSWPTLWEGRAGTATVESVDVAAGTANLSYQGLGFNMTATYDAGMGELSRLDFPGYATYEVTAHGYGHRGLVRVPHSHDLVFYNGRIFGALDFDSPVFPPPVRSYKETVEIQPGYDELSFLTSERGLSWFVGGTVPASAGYYQEKVTAPDGTVYQDTMLPDEGGVRFTFFNATNPTGTWTLEHVAGGPGMVFVEGIGYHSIDVSLPSGCVVASANAAHHAANCKVTEGSA